MWNAYLPVYHDARQENDVSSYRGTGRNEGGSFVDSLVRVGKVSCWRPPWLQVSRIGTLSVEKRRSEMFDYVE